ATAAAAALAIRDERVDLLCPGDEASRAFRNARRKLVELREATSAARIFVTDGARAARVDTDDGVPIGARLYPLDGDLAELRQAARRITRPVRLLVAAARAIGEGDLARPIEVTSRDEVGFLAATLETMRGQLRARDERLQMMLAGIAHEVRNPLGGMELFAGLLREALDGQPERLQEVARIEREIRYLKAVVSEFLEYARRPALELDDVRLRPRIEVRDSGPGVPAELRDKIFTPFFTTREKGTGLGLAFVREIVRDHGAEIAVGHAPEGGACFGFDLPRRTSTAARAAV